VAKKTAKQPTKSRRKKAYTKGARAEYKLKRKLEEAGWTVVRSAGSHGYWDLVAFKFRKGHVDIALIQVKAFEPTGRPKVIVQTGTFRAIEAVVFVYFGQAFLSRELPFSVNDPFRAFGLSRDGVQGASCRQRRQQPKGGRHDDRNE